MSWVETSDVLNRWVGENRPTDTVAVAAWIGDAEAMIRSTHPEVQARIDGGLLELDTVIRVVARMVLRVLRNPEGIRQTNESTGPFSVGKTFSGEDPGALALTSQDSIDLGFDPPSGHGKAFTVHPFIPPAP